MTAATATKVTVNVTRDHINFGRPCHTHECPIALALLDAIPRSADIAVHYDNEDDRAGVRVAIDGRYVSFDLSQEVASFILAVDDFDGDEEGKAALSPFSFEIEVPS